jgi:hypothetical protein
MSTPVSVPTRGVLKWSCDPAKAQPQSARGAICRRQDTTNSPSGASRNQLSRPKVVEGLNNKAKVTTRKSYGFRTYRVLELVLYHSLGKLPEPESTHDFF